MEIADVLKANRQQVLQIASQYGASHIRVFGSVARGEARPDSDIDFLVEMEPGRSLLDMGGLVVELRELLGCGVDVVTERGLKQRIRARVLAEAVPL
jgi:predicted nucleotidyltransferase